MRSLVAALALTLLVLAPAARAEQVVTVPAGSVDAIGTAILEAGPGGTVILAPGSHTLTETIIVAIPTLTVTGRGGATILGSGSDADGRLVLFSVLSDRFTLERVRIGAATASVGDLAVVVVDGGEGTTVSRCRATGITQLVDGGTASGLVVSKNRVEVADLAEAGAPAAHAVVIRAEGVRTATIEKNRLEGRRFPGSVGVEVLPPSGAKHVVAGNRLVGFDDGIAGEGGGTAVLSKNRVRGCENGVNVAQSITAKGWTIAGNHVRDVISTGIFLGNGDDCLVKGNRVLRAGTDGINVGGVLLEVRDNRTRLDGGIGVFGATSSSDFLGNVAKRCGVGIRVQGSGNLLGGNNGSKNLGDGVVSTGGNVKAEGNRGRKNGGLQVSIN